MNFALIISNVWTVLHEGTLHLYDPDLVEFLGSRVKGVLNSVNGNSLSYDVFLEVFSLLF